jgi:hypothetical protein
MPACRGGVELYPSRRGHGQPPLLYTSTPLLTARPSTNHNAHAIVPTSLPQTFQFDQQPPRIYSGRSLAPLWEAPRPWSTHGHSELQRPEVCLPRPGAVRS